MTIFWKRLTASMRQADFINPPFLSGDAPKTHAELMHLHGELGKFFETQKHWHEPDKCVAYSQKLRDLTVGLFEIETSDITRCKIKNNFGMSQFKVVFFS